MLRVQKLIPRVPPRLLAQALKGMELDAFTTWSFNHYLNIAGPSIAIEPEKRREPVAA